MEKFEQNSSLRFWPYDVTGINGQLLRRDRPLPVSPKAVAVLWVLASRAGQLVSKDDLFATVWAETVVSDGVLTSCIHELRQALGDAASKPRYIETVHRRGYRFLAEVVSRQYPVASNPPPLMPPFYRSTPDTHPSTSLFIGRDQELARLRRWWERAAAGERQVVFITGEPGIGKTTLVEAFLSGVGQQGIGNGKQIRQKAKVEDLAPVLVGRGQCIEHYGEGEAYLPVLEALGRLCRQPSGNRVVDVLKRNAPTWLMQLPGFVSDADFEVLQRKVQGVARERMLRELTEALEALTQEALLILMLEDLHWSDASTVDLLGMVARRREPARLLILGTYRPVDAILQAHPLRTLRQELQIHQQCEEIALPFLPDTAVAQYLDVRFPTHQFPSSLPQLLCQRTNGNPLFIVNMLNALVQQGVIGEEAGQWRLQAPLLEATVGTPESVRQVIQKQVERLTKEERQLLEVASVAGAEFSTAVLMADGIEARVGEDGCARLAQRGQFLLERGVAEWPDGTVATRYGFSHALYRNVLYEQLPSGRRIRLHRQVGNLLAHGYGERAREIAAELAMHFEQGREAPRAVQYRAQAAQIALQRSAFPEATTHVQRGLTLVTTLPDTPERAQLELPLYLSLGAIFAGAKGIGAPEIGRAFARARELSQQIGDATATFPVLIGLTAFYNARAEHKTALALARRCLSLAENSQDRAQLVMAYLYIGTNLLSLGDLDEARNAFDQGLALFEPRQHQTLVSVSGINTGAWAEAQMAWGLWLRGYPDQAARRSQHAAQVARALGHGNTSGVTLYLRGMTLAQCRALEDLEATMEEVMLLCTEHGIPAFLAASLALQNWGRVRQRRENEGLARVRQGFIDYRATGSLNLLSWGFGSLADACRTVGQIDEGLATLSEAFAFVEQTGERVYEAELWRLKGELLLQQRTGDSQD